MIGTFDVIAVAGTGNPKLLSGGISEALVTTLTGLVVAVPLLIAHAVLRVWSSGVTPDWNKRQRCCMVRGCRHRPRS